jgi:hypothetical protein
MEPSAPSAANDSPPKPPVCGAKCTLCAPVDEEGREPVPLDSLRGRAVDREHRWWQLPVRVILANVGVARSVSPMTRTTLARSAVASVLLVWPLWYGEPTRMTLAPTRMTLAPTRMTLAPTRMTLAPTRMTLAPTG